MKFIFLIILVVRCSTNYGICDSETFKVFCENKIQNKVRYRVEAVYHKSNKTNKKEVFSFNIPINTCKSENCEYCCLSTNRCGTKIQCENSQYFKKIINYIFIGLCVILVIAFIIKFYQIDPYPEQSNNEKIENMNDLINMFGIVRNNRKKLIT